MSSKTLIKNQLRELFSSISDSEWISAYTNKINNLRHNLLSNVKDNPDYVFLLGKNVIKLNYGEFNKCETNTYKFIKEKLLSGEDFYYPVGGFGFEGKELVPIEHWWCYNAQTKQFLDVTPCVGEDFRCYAGIINYELNNDIKMTNNVFDVDFFKGGNVYHKYFK
jgi:hypothetical protein